MNPRPGSVRPPQVRPEVLLGGLVVLLQIAYPLLHGEARSVLTVATVSVFAAAMLLHCARTCGAPAAVALLVVAGGIGAGAEVLGVHTGIPFGHYAYTDRLGARLAGVPVLIPLAWVMMAWPALCVSRRLTTGRTGTALVGGVALASWDLFLDPQMVAAGNWRWHDSGPALQGIPLVNDLGWLLVAIVLCGLLDRLLPRAESDALPLGLYLWTWLGSALANAAFFDRPVIAVIGGLGMGLVGLPLAATLWRRDPGHRWLAGTAQPAGR